MPPPLTHPQTAFANPTLYSKPLRAPPHDYISGCIFQRHYHWKTSVRPSHPCLRRQTMVDHSGSVC